VHRLRKLIAKLEVDLFLAKEKLRKGKHSQKVATA